MSDPTAGRAVHEHPALCHAQSKVISGVKADETIKLTAGVVTHLSVAVKGDATSYVELYNGAVTDADRRFRLPADVGGEGRNLNPAIEFPGGIHMKTVDAGATIQVNIAWR